MSSKNKHENYGFKHQGCSYTTLKDTWKYSCPSNNVNYPAFSNGVNCLCSKTRSRSLLIKKCPISNNQLGWKT